MTPIRTFIAIELDAKIKRELEQLQRRLQRAQAPVRWTSPEAMHLTLFFLGDVSPLSLEYIESTMNRIAGSFPSFHMDIGELGAFPSLENPRIIWPGITKRANILKEIAEQLKQELASLSLTQKTNDFIPHITLGRVGELSENSLLPQTLKKIPIPSGLSQKIESLSLFRSELLPKGAIYHRLYTAPLLS